MAKKQFKTESKKLLDMMVNSIYTHKEIFLRELISNASDAIDKLHFITLTDEAARNAAGEFEIRITPDKAARTLTIEDNGIGMNRDELESNLGTIAKSGSFDFKNDPEHKDADIDVIGQFGVGFYSAFMVADKITVLSRTVDSDEVWKWESEGADGYTVSLVEAGSAEADLRTKAGSTVILHLKDDTEDDKYGNYLEDYMIRSLVKKYSDYVRYPIKTIISTQKPKEGADGEYDTILEDTTLNSMTPIWKKKQSEVTDEQYNSFYKEKFFDYEDPLKVVRQATEGLVSYEALMFIPGRAPYNYYTKEYEKGLQLYSSGVMIMDKCADLLPDYFSFVKGIVDSPDLSLNISREMLQHDRQLKVIAKNLEKKIVSALSDMQEKDRENYEKFWKAFGIQLKYGVYNEYGMHKDVLQDLLMFKSTFEDKEVTLKEYVGRMREDQKKIFYAAGDSEEQLKMLPQVEAAKDKGYEVLLLTEYVDEFAIRMLVSYAEKEFANVCSEEFDISTQEEKENLKKQNEDSKDLLEFIKTSLDGKVGGVKYTNTLKGHAACISNEGELSANMEKTLNNMPGAEAEKVKANLVLEINTNHEIAAKLKTLFDTDKDTLAKYSKLLYSNARLASGLEIENPAEFSQLISELMVK